MRIMIGIVLTMIVLTAATLADDAIRELEYEVFAKGKRLGTITLHAQTVGTDSTPVVETITRTRLKAKTLFLTVFSLDSRSVYLNDIYGLARYETSGRLDGEDFSLSIVRNDTEYVIHTSDEGESGEYEIPRLAIDFTSESEPMDRLNKLHRAMRFRVFDIDRLEIVDRSYTWVGDEVLAIDETPVQCRMIDISDDHIQLRRWVARDIYDTMIKEEGIDEDGPYRVVLRSYSEASP